MGRVAIKPYSIKGASTLVDYLSTFVPLFFVLKIFLNISLTDISEDDILISQHIDRRYIVG